MSDKSFGVKQINLIGEESGTPTIESPNNLNLNAIQVAISSDLSIGGEIVSNVIVGSGYSVAISSDLSIGGEIVSNVIVGPGYSVGIGTTQPQQSLDVFGTIRATNFVKSDGTPIAGGGDNFWRESTSGGGIYTSFNVGIGTTNPTEKLTVDGNANISGIVSANAFSIEISTKYGPTGINSTDAVTNIKAIRFDKESAFNVTDLGNNEVLIVSADTTSTFKTWYVDGQPTLIASGPDEVEFIAGPGVAITTRNTATGVGTGEVKSLTFTSELVQESNPTLSADLDINNNNITGTGNININGIITATTFSGSGVGLTDIPNSAFQNAFVSYGGVTVSLGNSDPTPAFDLQDAFGLPVSTGVSGLGANVATFLATPSSSNLVAAVTDGTGTGSLVFNDSPQFINPGLGTPSSGDLTNCTGLPVSSGVSGLGANVATFLATPSSSNLASAVTDETGTGSLVFATSPTLISPALGTPSSGDLINCTGLPIDGVTGISTGVVGFLSTLTSASLAEAVTDETGTGSLVFATSPTLVSPILGTPSSGTLTNCTGLPVSTGVSGLGANVVGFLTAPSSSTLRGAVTDETGSGSLVFATSPTLVSPILGTPLSGTLTNCTGLPISGVGGLGANVATFLTTPSSSNLASAVTDETGSGALVFATSPTLVTPALGTPSSGTLTNCTGLPIGGVTGLGANVATFLATPSSSNLASAVTDETGSGSLVFATSPTLVTPALGTPSSGTLTNCTGLPVSSGVSGLGANVATFLATPSSSNLASAVTDETGSGALVFGSGPTLSNVRLSNALYDNNNSTGSNGQFLQSSGSGVIWADSGLSITNDTSTNSTYYPSFTSATSGPITQAFVSSTKLNFNPSTGNFSATQFTSLSDATKKTNIRPVENALEITKQLEGVRFNWIDNDRPSVGLIAQDVEKVLPELVETSNDGTKSVSYGNIIGVLIEAIKEQQKLIEKLERKINA